MARYRATQRAVSETCSMVPDGSLTLLPGGDGAESYSGWSAASSDGPYLSPRGGSWNLLVGHRACAERGRSPPGTSRHAARVRVRSASTRRADSGGGPERAQDPRLAGGGG